MLKLFWSKKRCKDNAVKKVSSASLNLKFSILFVEKNRNTQKTWILEIIDDKCLDMQSLNKFFREILL